MKNQKRAGAPFGNKNAEKWTFRKSIELFNKAIEMANEKSYQQIPVSGGMPIKKEQGFKYDFIGEIASELGLYKEIFTNLVNRFPSLKKKHNLLITKLESNCYYNGKNGNIKEASSIMNLKSNHGWTDRTINTQIIQEQRKSVDELFPKDEEINGTENS